MEEAKAIVVSGEAPESDDESVITKTGISFPTLLVSSSCGTIIQGEARESDDENNSVSSASYADPSVCSYPDIRGRRNEKKSVKYNSLLHKKLRECNKSLDKNIQELLSTTISSAVEELTETNKQLLKSEIVLQESVNKLQTCSSQFEKSFNCLEAIIDENYFHKIKL